jgi:hypothetical protein
MTEKKQALIHIDPAVENGRYANAATIMHSPSEFILDFLMLFPGNRRKVVSRVIVSPVQAKQIAGALQENVNRYETVYGEIKIPRQEGEFTGQVN